MAALHVSDVISMCLYRCVSPYVSIVSYVNTLFDVSN